MCAPVVLPIRQQRYIRTADNLRRSPPPPHHRKTNVTIPGKNDNRENLVGPLLAHNFLGSRRPPPPPLLPFSLLMLACPPGCCLSASVGLVKCCRLASDRVAAPSLAHPHIRRRKGTTRSDCRRKTCDRRPRTSYPRTRRSSGAPSCWPSSAPR